MSLAGARLQSSSGHVAPGVRARLLAQVSEMYWVDGLTQADIACRLHLSRPNVSRLLGAARDAGIVRILVKPPRGVFALLETELESRFGLREVRVVPRAPRREVRQLGIAAAADFRRSVRAGHAIGLVGGALVAAMVDAVAPMTGSGVRVVQALGWEDVRAPQRTLMDLVLELARRIEGTAVPLPVPSIVASAMVERCLWQDPHIGETRRALDALEALYVELSADASPVAGRATPHGHPVAVGHLARRWFDRDGGFLGEAVDGHVVGITVPQMRRAGHVVALAHGAANAHAIVSALRTGVIGTLITDELTARAMTALHGPENEHLVPSVHLSRPRRTR